MSKVVTEARFLGPNLLVQTLIRASDFAQNPTILGTELPAILPAHAAMAISQNDDIQELGLLERVLEEKALRDFEQPKSEQSTLSRWLCVIGNAKPSKDDPLASITKIFPHSIPVQEFVVSAQGLKRILVMRDSIGFDGIEKALSGRKFVNQDQTRKFIRNVITEEITDHVAAIAGIEDTLPLHDLIENLLHQSREAYKINDGWRRDMMGAYAAMMQDANRVFSKRQRSITLAGQKLAMMPMRGTFRFETAQPSSVPA